MKKLLGCLFILLLFGVASAVYAWHQLEQIRYAPFSQAEQDNPHYFTIARGTNSQQLAQQLHQAGIISQPYWLPILLRLNPEYAQIKAGTYEISAVKNLHDLLLLFNSGKEAQLAIRFTDGETFKQLQQHLANAPYLNNQLSEKSIDEIMQLLAIPNYAKNAYQWKSLEGWIYPDTYHYTPYSSDLDLLKRASTRTIKLLDQAWQQRDKDLPLANPYELLILASIIEKETAIDSERGKVASVFVNRLKRNMRLQTDPTVIYGMGDAYQGNIRRKDLQQATPYNTYVIDGLPPTPIAMPSEKSIMAAANPDKTDFLYFVADGLGGHKFSKTLGEHNRAVQQYLRWYRENYQK